MMPFNLNNPYLNKRTLSQKIKGKRLQETNFSGSRRVYWFDQRTNSLVTWLICTSDFLIKVLNVSNILHFLSLNDDVALVAIFWLRWRLPLTEMVPGYDDFVPCSQNQGDPTNVYRDFIKTGSLERADKILTRNDINLLGAFLNNSIWTFGLD